MLAIRLSKLRAVSILVTTTVTCIACKNRNFNSAGSVKRVSEEEAGFGVAPKESGLPVLDAMLEYAKSAQGFGATSKIVATCGLDSSLKLLPDEPDALAIVLYKGENSVDSIVAFYNDSVPMSGTAVAFTIEKTFATGAVYSFTAKQSYPYFPRALVWMKGAREDTRARMALEIDVTDSNKPKFKIGPMKGSCDAKNQASFPDVLAALANPSTSNSKVAVPAGSPDDAVSCATFCGERRIETKSTTRKSCTIKLGNNLFDDYPPDCAAGEAFTVRVIQ